MKQRAYPMRSAEMAHLLYEASPKPLAVRHSNHVASQGDRHARNLSPRHTTAVDLAAGHGRTDTLDSRRNLAAARLRLRGQSPAGGGSHD